MANEMRHWDINDNAKRIDEFWKSSDFEIQLRQRVCELIIDAIGEGGKIFEVGCGSCMCYKYLKGKVEYTCGDVSEEFRKLAKIQYPELNPIFVDVYHLPFKDTEVPNVMNISVLQHLPYYEEPVKELIRVAQNNVLIVTWGTKKMRGKDKLGQCRSFADIFYNNRYNMSKFVKFCESQPGVSKVNLLCIQDANYWIQIEKDGWCK